MKQYHDLVKYVLEIGTHKENRTGVDTISAFNYNYAVDLKDGFPLLTTKKISWKNIVIELLWFLSGKKNTEFLKKHNCKFWDPWTDEFGNVNSGYGFYWRHFPFVGQERIVESVDQIKFVLSELKTNPNSRRMIVNVWNPGDAIKNKLPPCHFSQVYNVQNSDILNLHLSQRSGDIALGIPYNLASYSLLLTLMAQLSGLVPGKFAHSIVDCHIYENHISRLKEQLTREPKPLPKLIIDSTLRDLKDVEELLGPKLTTEEIMSHFVLEDYLPYEPIRFEVAV